MRINYLLVLCAVCSQSLVAKPAASAIIDSINGSAAPATPGTPVTHESFENIGWYYTPSTSYSLTGIYSVFGPAPGATGTNTITVQIQSERPAVGGSVLAQATFDAPQAPGGQHGGTFSPLQLTAGETYFVNFLGIRGMGVNVGSWDFDVNLNPQLTDGATMNLGAFYRDDAGLFATESTNPWGIAGDGVTHISGTAPILMFEGFTVPEPTSLVMVTIAGGALMLRRRGAGGRT